MKTIFEKVIEKQIKYEAHHWINLEGARDIVVHEPNLIDIVDGVIKYCVVVTYRPAKKKDFEVAMLEVVAFDWGTTVINEKRTEKEETVND